MTTKTVSVRDIPEDTWKLLRVEAAKTGKNMSTLVDEAIKAYLNRKDGRK